MTPVNVFASHRKPTGESPPSTPQLGTLGRDPAGRLGARWLALRRVRQGRTGIFQRLSDPSTAPSAVAAFDNFVAAFSGGVDGLWANTVKEVAIVGGVETYRLSASTFRDPATGTAGGRGDKAFADYAMAMYGGWWTNSRMPDPATFMSVANVQQAILYRMGRSMKGGAGAMRTAVCPHWNVIDIDDIYSGSAQGERYFTMHVLLGDVILVQPNAYAQIAFQVA